MEEITWMHYCEDPRTKRFVLCNIKNLKEVGTWRYNVPYESLYCFNTAQVDNLIFFTGGGNPSSETSAEQFFQLTMRVTIMPSMEIIVDKMANMISQRANHGMESIGKKYLYALGGTNSSGYLDSCEEYNIETDSWRAIANLNEKKKWISVCALNNKYLYSFGGSISDNIEVSKTIECLDVTDSSAKTWSVIKIASGEELLKASFFIGVMNISDSCILLFGGHIKTEEDTCVAFDPYKKTIEKQKGLLKRDSFYRTKYGVNGKDYAIVGCHDGDLHIYNEDAKKWSLMVKKIWNPKYEIAIKADTF